MTVMEKVLRVLGVFLIAFSFTSLMLLAEGDETLGEVTEIEIDPFDKDEILRFQEAIMEIVELRDRHIAMTARRNNVDLRKFNFNLQTYTFILVKKPETEPEE